MHILCPLTEWETSTVEKGLHTGKVVTTRLIIGFDSWNISIALERKGYESITGQKYFGSMRLLVEYLCEHDYDPKVIVPRMVKSLTEKTGTLMEVPSISVIVGLYGIFPEDDPLVRGKIERKAWIDFGRKIDLTFDTNFGRPDREYPPKITARIFKVTDSEEIAETI